MQVDILAFGAHPDDIELGCGGTLAKHVALGHTVGLVDLTRGEMGSRGTVLERDSEAVKAAQILGASFRLNLDLPDGRLVNDFERQQRIIELVRRHRPRIVLCNAPKDRHPDHGVASAMVVEACFRAGLHKWASVGEDGAPQAPFRPEHVYHYIQFYDLPADFTVDISGFIDAKMDSLAAHASQFYQEGAEGPETVISSKWFWESLTARTAEWGRTMGVAHAEGFIAPRRLGVDSLFDLK
ncbi:MAG: bacillithiol biosynthesis deacetylase BshB1 [Bacteroidota bacterium]